MSRPIYCLTNDRKYAISVNFARLGRERPGYGYDGLEDPTIDYAHPDNDGIFIVDIEKNTAELVISLDQLRSSTVGARGTTMSAATSPTCSRQILMDQTFIR